DRRTVNYHIKKARTALNQNFKPAYLGLASVSKADIQAHTTENAKALFSSLKTILVLDGTYAYIQKSSNFEFQRQSFSLHKHRNLMKMFMVVSTDGYSIDVTGPFEANASDSKLMEDFM